MVQTKNLDIMCAETFDWQRRYTYISAESHLNLANPLKTEEKHTALSFVHLQSWQPHPPYRHAHMLCADKLPSQDFSYLFCTCNRRHTWKKKLKIQQNFINMSTTLRLLDCSESENCTPILWGQLVQNRRRRKKHWVDSQETNTYPSLRCKNYRFVCSYISYIMLPVGPELPLLLSPLLSETKSTSCVLSLFLSVSSDTWRLLVVQRCHLVCSWREQQK